MLLAGCMSVVLDQLDRAVPRSDRQFRSLKRRRQRAAITHTEIRVLVRLKTSIRKQLRVGHAIQTLLPVRMMVRMNTILNAAVFAKVFSHCEMGS